MSLKLTFIAPDLVKPGGHALAWANDLGRAFVDHWGAKVTIYGHQRASPAVRTHLDERIVFVPCFSTSPYVAAKLARLPFLGQVHAQVHRQGLLQGFARLPSDSDLWVVTTLFPSTAAALASWTERPPVAGIVHMAPNEYWHRSHFASLPPRLSLHATTARVQAAFAAESLSATCLPHIVNVPRRVANRPGVRTIGLLGRQRPEKGQKFLVSLANALLEAGFQVFLHDSQSNDATRSSDPLGLLRAGYVADFGHVIDRCDLVLTPYDPGRYRSRMSGVAVDALARAVPCIVPADSHAGDLVDRFAAGQVVDRMSVETLLAAAQTVARDYRAHARGAQAAAAWLRAEHGTKRAAEALLMPLQRGWYTSATTEGAATHGKPQKI